MNAARFICSVKASLFESLRLLTNGSDFQRKPAQRVTDM